MTVTQQTMEKWLRNLLGANPAETRLPLEDYLRSIPKLESLSDVPA